MNYTVYGYENNICIIRAMLFSFALDSNNWFYFILFNLFFLQWNHVIFLCMKNCLNVFLLVINSLYVFFSQFCSHFDVKLDLVNNKPIN